jgi:type III secretion system low calcium response chaperone LcrH/SycD
MQTSDFLTKEAQEASYYLAHTFYRQGKYEEASSLFRMLTLAGPTTRKFWMGLGASLQMNKDYKEALNAYELAARLDPTDPHVHLYAADCFFTQGEAEEGLFALDCAERALTFSPQKQQNFKAHIQLLRRIWRKNHG